MRHSENQVARLSEVRVAGAWTTVCVAVRVHETVSVLVLGGRDKGADHGATAVVIGQVVVQDVEPELIARRIKISPKLTVVLH